MKALKNRLALDDVSSYDVAQWISRSNVYVVQKLKGVSPFTVWEMWTIADRLGIEPKDLRKFFPDS